MISIFSESYNVTLEENAQTSTPSAAARIVRQATLDGGVSFEHLGLCHGDRDFSISAEATEDQVADLRGMHENETLVYCVTREGVFSGAISKIKPNRGAVDITFMVKEKIQ